MFKMLIAFEGWHLPNYLARRKAAIKQGSIRTIAGMAHLALCLMAVEVFLSLDLAHGANPSDKSASNSFPQVVNPNEYTPKALTNSSISSPLLSSAPPLQRETHPITSNPGSGAYRAVFLILFLTALFGWVRWKQQFVRRSGSSATIRNWRTWLITPANVTNLKVVQSTRLTPRASAHVLQWDGKEWLVGCTERSITVLGQRNLPIDSPTPGVEAPPPGGMDAHI